MDFSKIRDIIVSAANDAGIEKYEIYCTTEENIEAETLKHEISSISSGMTGGVGFRCIVDGHMGYASTNSLDADELASLVTRAADNARVIENDDEVFIFEGSESYAKTTAGEPTVTDAATLKECALKLQEKLYGYSEAVIDGTQSAAISFVSEIYLYNSYGLELTNKVGMSGSYASAVISVDGEKQSGFEFAFGTDGEGVDALPAKAVDGAIEKIGAGFVESGKYDIVLSGKQMRTILSAYSSVFSAKNAQMGLSLLAGKEGEKIASDIVTITDDPMREGCPVQTAFDGEGVAAYKKNVVENGVLNTLLYDLKTAKKAGKTTTANGQRGSYASQVHIAPYNFSISAGENTFDELFAAVGNGIYITELKGLHAGADPVTGDFSIESAGFKIEDGKKAGAVKTFTIAGNFFTLLKSITMVADKVEWGIPGGFTVFGSPAVLVEGISVAGK